MSFFSYQPSQGLSNYKNKPLQRTGSGEQDFIDPSLDPRGGIDDLSLGDEGVDSRDIGQTEGGGFFNTQTGTQFGVSDQLRSMLDQQEENPRAAQQAAQGPQGADVGGLGGSGMGLIKNVVSGAKTAFQKPDMFGGEPGSDLDTQGTLSGSEADWTSPEAVGKWLQNAPPGEAGFKFDSPESVDTSGFRLSDTGGLDASFLDSFTNPETVTSVGSGAGMFGDLVSQDFNMDGNVAGFNVSDAFDAVGVGASVAKLLAQVTGDADTAKLIGVAASTAAGAKAIASIVQNGAGVANVAGVVSAIVGALQAAGVLKDSQELQVMTKMANAAVLAVTTALSATVVGAVVASVINTGMTIYGGLESEQTWEQQLANAIFASTPLGLVDVGGGLSEMVVEATAPNSKQWRSFNTELMRGQGQQGKAFGILSEALPYVQNKEELGRLINSYKNYISTTTGIPLTDNVDNPYGLDAIPGTGTGSGGVSVSHGKRVPATDWSNAQTQLQNLIDAYYEVLPGDPITGGYGPTPDNPQGGGLGEEAGPRGEAGRRLWRQFFSGDNDSISYFPEGVEPTEDYKAGLALATKNGYGTPGEDKIAAYTGAGQPYLYVSGFEGNYGRPSWDPETGQYVYTGVGTPAPKSAKNYFQQSPYWQQLLTGVGPEDAQSQGAVPQSQDMTQTQGQAPGQPMDQSQRGLSSFDPNNPDAMQQQDNRGIPDDGNPNHPYELINGRPVHPEVWGIPGMRVN